MPEIFISVDDRVFAQFPGYLRGVVVAHDVSNGDSPDELITELRQAEASLRGTIKVEALAEHPRIKSWREAFRAFGAKPSEFRSSIEAMTRRVLRNEALPTINALVDIGNLISLRYLVPTGGHAIDGLRDDMILRPATGQESFTPFGSDQTESPMPSEIIFAEGNIVLTRRWVWRQANHTLLLATTRAVEFNVDALPPVSSSEVEGICTEIMRLVQRFCGGQARYEVLSRQHPRLPLMG